MRGMWCTKSIYDELPDLMMKKEDILDKKSKVIIALLIGSITLLIFSWLSVSLMDYFDFFNNIFLSIHYVVIMISIYGAAISFLVLLFAIIRKVLKSRSAP